MLRITKIVPQLCQNAPARAVCSHSQARYFPPPISFAQAAIANISKARTVVRQMKTLGKAKKLAKAEAKLAKLKAKEVGLG